MTATERVSSMCCGIVCAVIDSHQQEGTDMRTAIVVLVLVLTSVSVGRADPVTLTVNGLIDACKKIAPKLA